MSATAVRGTGRDRWTLLTAVLFAASVAACVPAGGSSGSPSDAASLPTPSPAPSVAAPTTGNSPAPSSPTTDDPADPEPSPTVAVATRVLFEGAVGPTPRSVADRAWEPVLATHPTDPDRIAVIYQHRGPGAACSLNPVIRISHDGGRTWRSTRSGPGARSGRGMGLHAAIAWGPGPSGGSRLYWANMTTPGCGDGRYSLTTAYSDDEGRTWSRLRVERRTRPWVGGFPEIAVDRDPRSPNHGTVYVAYNWLGKGAHGPGFRLLASSDFGTTWRTAEVKPARLARGARGWWRIAYRLRPAPDGSVYAAWYQVDLRRWDQRNIFAKGGPANVKRLGIGVARIRFDAATGSLLVGPSRIATTIRETAWTTRSGSAPGTSGNIRPDPMWQYGFDVDPDGRLFLAVAGYGWVSKDLARGTIRAGRSDDRGRTWSFETLQSPPTRRGHQQSMLRPNLVAGPGYVLVTFRTLDDVHAGATMGVAYSLSTDGGAHWRYSGAVSRIRWRASNLAGVVNGAGLRERAERAADGDVVWAFGEGRLATGRAAGRTAIFAARIDVVVR